MAARALTVLWLLVALAGCGDDEDTDPIDEPEPRHHGAGGHHSTGVEHGPRPEQPPARFGRVSGVVTVEGAQARAGMAVEAERTVEVPANGSAVLQLRDGARLELDAGSVARVVDEGPTQLILVRGRVFASQPPSGNTARPPLRIATPGATLEIGGAGEIYASTFENGSTWVTTLEGNSTATSGEADNRRRLRVADVVEGQAVAVAGRVADPTEGPGRLAAARAAAGALAAGEGMNEADTEAAGRAFAQELERLDQSLRWLETETRNGSELTTQHRAAVQAGNREEAQRLQRELVGHSQELYRLRQIARARWDRARAQHLWLGLLDAAPAEDPIAARHDRVAGLLGF